MQWYTKCIVLTNFDEIIVWEKITHVFCFCSSSSQLEELLCMKTLRNSFQFVGRLDSRTEQLRKFSCLLFSLDFLFCHLCQPFTWQSQGSRFAHKAILIDSTHCHGCLNLLKITTWISKQSIFFIAVCVVEQSAVQFVFLCFTFYCFN